jgi:hypothetical protein
MAHYVIRLPGDGPPTYYCGGSTTTSCEQATAFPSEADTLAFAQRRGVVILDVEECPCPARFGTPPLGRWLEAEGIYRK